MPSLKELPGVRKIWRRLEPVQPRDVTEHALWEDIYSLLVGSSFLAVALILLKDAGLVTGGVAGIALLFSYLLPIEVSVLFLLVNLPFFLWAPKIMGWRFAIKTVTLIVLVMAWGLFLPTVFELGEVNRVFAAIFGGTIAGVGVLSLARHATGVGGAGIVALWLQKSKGWSAGRLLLMVDCTVLLLALTVIDFQSFILSILSAVALNGVLIANHRPGRYAGH